MKENKVSLVMASMCLEPLYLIRGEMQLPMWTMMPGMVNFVLTYAYDWGPKELGWGLAVCYVCAAWYYDVLVFSPLMLATVWYDQVVQTVPTMKNSFVAGMYAVNFVVIPWYIGSDAPFPTWLVVAYLIRVMAFELHDDVLDIAEDRPTQRQTLATQLGEPPSLWLVMGLLCVSGWRRTASVWRWQTLFDALLMFTHPQHALGRGWVLTLGTFLEFG